MRGIHGVAMEEPRTEFSMNGGFAISTGLRGASAWRLPIQALRISRGRNVGSMPSASAALCGFVTALVRMRWPAGYPLMRSNSSAGQSGIPAATSVMAPIS